MTIIHKSVIALLALAAFRSDVGGFTVPKASYVGSSNILSMKLEAPTTEIKPSSPEQLPATAQMMTSVFPPPSTQAPTGPSIRNLKNLRSMGNSEIKENQALQSWNEFQGLSEKQFTAAVSEPGTGSSTKDRKVLELSYRRCEYVTKLFSKTFYMGTSLMDPAARQHTWAIYAWCRRTDDIVDSPRALLSQENLSNDLRDWEERLERIWAGKPKDLFDLAMSDTVRAYPTMPIQPFRDMIAGMVMDVPGMGKDRYQNFDELYLYCYRVAGTVGLMTLPVLGVASEDGYTEEQASEPALALGIALQLTNILRDVGEDLERGRIYLPQDELAEFGLTEQDLFDCVVTPKYREFMKFQIARARDYYRKAALGIPMLSKSGRFAVQASLDLYGKILDVIERNDYDNFNKRAFTTKFEKLGILPQSYYKANFFEKPK